MTGRRWPPGRAHLPVTVLGAVLHLAEKALAHGSFSLDDERLNVGLVALSFAMIAAFAFLATQRKGGRGQRIR